MAMKLIKSSAGMSKIILKVLIKVYLVIFLLPLSDRRIGDKSLLVFTNSLLPLALVCLSFPGSSSHPCQKNVTR